MCPVSLLSTSFVSSGIWRHKDFEFNFPETEASITSTVLKSDFCRYCCKQEMPAAGCSAHPSKALDQVRRCFKRAVMSLPCKVFRCLLPSSVVSPMSAAPRKPQSDPQTLSLQFLSHGAEIRTCFSLTSCNFAWLPSQGKGVEQTFREV